MLKKTLSMQKNLLAWFDLNRRSMPWRAEAGGSPNPYHVWLSEVMLQQTTVATVGPYFQKFIDKWPRLDDLARAAQDEVLVAWAGLGYYARARNLHKCAGIVMREYGGIFPDTEEGLLALPGIGPYTAGAISAIAFDRPAIAVDGNVERVVSRLYGIETPLPASKPEIKKRAMELSAGNPRPGDFVQALMELGSIVCTPDKPRCAQCPLRSACRARIAGKVEVLPRRASKASRPSRYGAVFWLEDGKGRVLMRKRPEKGLLGGMTEVPSTQWHEKWASQADLLRQAPLPGIKWHAVTDGSVRHVFSHFNLELQVLRGQINAKARRPEGFWVGPEELKDQALPSLMQKVVKLVKARH